jgi:hypothetical protein
MNAALQNSEFGKYKEAMRKETIKEDANGFIDDAADLFCRDFFADDFEDDALVLKADEVKKLSLDYILNRDAINTSKSGKQKKVISDPIASAQALFTYCSKNRAYLDSLVIRNNIAEIKFRDMYSAFSFEELKSDKIDEYLLQNVGIFKLSDYE